MVELSDDLLVILGIFASIVFFFGLLGVVISILWNFVMPSIFGSPHIDWLQSLVLMVLLGLLFGWVKIEAS